MYADCARFLLIPLFDPILTYVDRICYAVSIMLGYVIMFCCFFVEYSMQDLLWRVFGDGLVGLGWKIVSFYCVWRRFCFSWLWEERLFFCGFEDSEGFFGIEVG